MANAVAAKLKGVAAGGFDPKKSLRDLVGLARRAPAAFVTLLVGAAAMGVLEVVSIVSADRRIAAIALAHTASTLNGPVPGAIGAHLSGVVDVRIAALVLGTLVVVVALVRAARFPVQDFIDRALFALVAVALLVTGVSVLAARTIASPRHVLDWGLGDAPLLLLAASLCVVLVRLAVVRARWLDRVRHGLDRDFSLELLQASVDRQLPLLPGQRRGDAVLLSSVAVPGRPPVTMALARVDYAEQPGPDRRRALYLALGVVSLGSALAIAAALVIPESVPLAVSPLGAAITTFAFPDARPIEQPGTTGAASAIVVPDDDSLAPTPLVIDADGKVNVIDRGAGVPITVSVPVVDLSPDGTCLRDLDGEVLCQKHDVSGYVKVKDIIGAASFSSRGEHGCAVVVGGEVRCWKDDSTDVLIPPHSPPVAAPVRDLPPAKMVAVGETFACAVTLDRAVRCWTGQGIATSPSHAVGGAEGTVALAAGTEHACAVQDKGTVVCWGRDDLGQTGPAGNGSDTLGTPVAGVDGAVELALGATHSCARLGSGAVTCWGFLDSGTWSTAPRLLPLDPSLHLVARDGAVCSQQTNRIVCAGDRAAP